MFLLTSELLVADIHPVLPTIRHKIVHVPSRAILHVNPLMVGARILTHANYDVDECCGLSDLPVNTRRARCGSGVGEVDDEVPDGLEEVLHTEIWSE